MAKDIYISSGTTTIKSVTSDNYHVGGTAKVIVSSGGNVNVFLERVPSAGTGGHAEVYNGGVIQGAVHDYGLLSVSSGGTALGVSYWDTGSQYIKPGGICSEGIVYSDAKLYVSGGHTYDLDVRNGGSLRLCGYSSGSMYYSGYANNTSLGGFLVVSYGATANLTKVSSGGIIWVEKGGRAQRTTVEGEMFISSGGSATSNYVRAGGRLTVYGSATSNYVSSGGKIGIAGGGIASETTVNSGGEMRISSGGTASATTVSSGGTMTVSDGGKALGGEIVGGTAYIDSCSVSGITMKSGYMEIRSGGTALGTVMSGGRLVLDGASYNGEYKGGKVTIDAGAHSENEVFSAGEFYVLGRGSASGNVYNGTIGSGVTMNISGGRFGGKTVSNAVINVTTGFADVSALNGAVATIRGGTFFASAGGIMTSAVISEYGGSKGKMYVMSGAIVKDVNVSANAHLGIMIGGSVTYASAGHSSGSDSASIGVSSGGRLDQAFVYGGMLDIGSGGNVTSAIFSSGGEATVSGTLGVALVGPGSPVQISSGGAINSALIKGGGSINVNGGKLYNATVASYGILSIASGGVASGGTIHGSALVDATGLMNGGTVSSGGKLDINVSGSAMGTLIESGGRVIVSSGGVLFGGSAGAGGIISALSGCNAALCVISSGGTIQCKKGANVTFSLIESGGKITGTYNCSSLVFSAGAIVDFDIFNRYAGNASAFISELGEAISQSAVFTLSVFDTQENGTYKLASGAAGFDKTITVQNTAGTELGTLKIGQATNIGNQIYKLELDSDDVLSVSVGAGAPTGPAKSDIDGNGFSDVMFVWTGEHGEGNYQHGYWMNGTSEWQSANCGHPANWDNLGCYDMNGDGKADSVLFGNVDAYEVPSAYIGYYQDGIDTDENWVTIGFLTNAAGIDWKNAVGNLTGNASGVNSIVWYAPELSALGAWKDGAEDWVTLSGDFGGYAWKLVGCGDFDGDGKDSVLMTYNNGQMFYTVGINEAPARLGISDWSGWKVCAIGDFSGDKKDDIVLFHNDTGAMVMCANGYVDSYESIGQLDKNDWFVVGAGDYNGDTRDDLLVRQYSTGMLGYYVSGDTSKWVELGRGVDMKWTVIA